MQKLTRAGVALATTGLSLLGFGMAMGNLELLVLATIPLLLLVTSLSLRPSEGEVARNPRARSAKLRVAERSESC